MPVDLTERERRAVPSDDATDGTGWEWLLLAGIAVIGIGVTGNDWARTVDDEPAVLVSSLLLPVGCGLLGVGAWKARPWLAARRRTAQLRERELVPVEARLAPHIREWEGAVKLPPPSLLPPPPLLPRLAADRAWETTPAPPKGPPFLSQGWHLALLELLLAAILVGTHLWAHPWEWWEDGERVEGEVVGYTENGEGYAIISDRAGERRLTLVDLTYEDVEYGDRLLVVVSPHDPHDVAHQDNVLDYYLAWVAVALAMLLAPVVHVAVCHFSQRKAAGASATVGRRGVSGGCE